MSKAHSRKILDIGCGKNKREPKAVGLDIRDYDPVDVVADIDREELPFESDRFERILTYSVLEHMENLPSVMEKIHRIAEDGAVVEGKVPHWKDRNAYIDPTHKRFFDERTFDYWDPTTEYGDLEYFDVEFRVRRSQRVRRLQFWKSRPIEFKLEVVK
ncbi:class I SAM-dependent methyltransferase [Halostella sp. JP-L12]|uniref:methyltransferase domain-containing protein n=1 Tax=Halostella TaxID=1843185 RepID=UPI000EF7FB1F|nr:MULTISPECIES: methyltransferase domain-containing protein [Halostella]NHN48718.1 class I SAM-dependent methyltransferase [Halostella sp. JP-L12]